MKTSLALALGLLTVSVTASATLAGFNDQRSIGLISQNSQIFFSQSILLKEGTEARSVTGRRGACQLNYNKSDLARQLDIDTPATIMAVNQNLLYASADGADLTISCVSGTTIGQLERELFKVGAQLVLSK